MTGPEILKEQKIQDLMDQLPFWYRDGKVICREIVAANFVAAIGILNSIAIIAEVADHHPDMLIYGWNKIRITLFSHDCGGLTQLDFDLAKKIDNLKF
jgi:4a-hydroxytetrahydrobiopterin dehydratase